MVIEGVLRLVHYCIEFSGFWKLVSFV